MEKPNEKQQCLKAQNLYYFLLTKQFNHVILTEAKLKTNNYLKTFHTFYFFSVNITKTV